jgi:hypothetical protein
MSRRAVLAPTHRPKQVDYAPGTPVWRSAWLGCVWGTEQSGTRRGKRCWCLGGFHGVKPRYSPI